MKQIQKQLSAILNFLFNPKVKPFIRGGLLLELIFYCFLPYVQQGIEYFNVLLFSIFVPLVCHVNNKCPETQYSIDFHKVVLFQSWAHNHHF
jgi:hypothetical protein